MRLIDHELEDTGEVELEDTGEVAIEDIGDSGRGCKSTIWSSRTLLIRQKKKSNFSSFRGVNIFMLQK